MKHCFFLESWHIIPYIPPDTMTKNTVLTAAAAGAAGLGGSVAVTALSGTQPEDLPPVKKKQEEQEETTETEPDETPASLPETDTLGVNMELYVPYKALINTKGAAANIMVTINGGNGYHWHYIPTAICLDGPKSIFPTIVGTGNTATLILSMTGAEMKVPHSTIFITIIAWAYAPNGQLVKTSATKEIPFHSKGLEAVRGKNDTLKITYYGDSNLDGIAEITELNADEYDISEDSDSLIITAKDFRLGSCKIPKINP